MRQAMLTLQNEDKTLTFKVKADWQVDSLDLTIFAEEAWHTHVSGDDMEKLASERNQTAKDYFTSLQEYITDVNPSVCFNLSYENSAEDENEMALFTITRKTGTRAILIFKGKLRKMDFHKCIYELLDDLMEKHNELCKRVQVLQKEKVELEMEKNIYEDKLIEFIERKSKWEQEMYSNFLLLLNEKKKRIKFLTGILKRKNIDPNEQMIERDCELPLKKKNKRANRLEQLSNSESSNYSDSEDYNTDTSANDNGERHEPTPSTSRQDLNLEEPENEETHMSLPKRTKVVEDQDTVVALELSKEEKETIEKENDVLSPQLEFSTQDLIDRM